MSEEIELEALAQQLVGDLADAALPGGAGIRHDDIDAAEALALIPPLVTVREVQTFLTAALRRTPLFDSSVVRAVSKARDEAMQRRVMIKESRRVKVVDSRMCVRFFPLCWLALT